MLYAYTILYVDNVTLTIDFYVKAFGFEKKFVTPEADYGELLTGNTTISFASKFLAQSNLTSQIRFSKPNDEPLGIELAFTSTTIEADIETAINAGATVASSLTTKQWGQQVCYLRDINGFLIEVCTPIKSSK